MTLPANHERLSLSPDGPGRPRLLLRDAADISRLRMYLLTHWKLPRIEVCVERLPALDSQRAQDRFARLSGACNCLLGEILAGATLLGGSFWAWASIRSWHALGSVVVTTLYAGLIGKGIELAWTRVRLLLVLRRLRRRLADVAAGRQAKPLVKVREPVLMAGNSDVAQDNRIQRPLLPEGPRRPKVLLRNAADINRLVLRVVTRWTLPRIEIHLDALPKLDAQRAQDRFARLSEGRNYLLAGVLATACTLSGLFYIVWMSSGEWMWTAGKGGRDVGLVAVATLYAALIGAAIEMVWIRLRLLLVLRGLRRRLRMA